MTALITAALIRTLTPDSEVWDTRCRGLVLRVRRSGRKVYRFQLRRNQWITIGGTDDFDPNQAREEGDKLRGDVARRKDPRAERRRASGESLDRFLDIEYQPWAKAMHEAGEKKGDIHAADRLRAVCKEFLALPLEQITLPRVTRWKTSRLAAGTSAATVNRDLAALRSVISYAFEQELLSVHPLRKLKFPKVKVERGVVRFLSAEEDTRLRDALTARDERRRAARARANAWRRARGYAEWPAFGTYTDHLTPIVLLALNTGLRRGELLQLDWTDVALDRATLTVRGDVAKSGESRDIPLNTDAVAVLRAWQPVEDDRRVVPFRRRRSSLVFPGDDGEQMGGLKSAFNAIFKAAAITRFRFHDLRHDFASKLVMAGVDLNTVRELLGHADLKMTLRYAHLAPEHKAAAVAKLVTA